MTTHTDVTPAESSSNSIASSDKLPELKYEHRFANNDIFDRLHTSKDRKLGEAPIMDTLPMKAVVVQVSPALAEKRGKSWLSKGKVKDSAVAIAA